MFNKADVYRRNSRRHFIGQNKATLVTQEACQRTGTAFIYTRKQSSAMEIRPLDSHYYRRQTNPFVKNGSLDDETTISQLDSHQSFEM